MSGHSHWSSIKHKKAAIDKKRGRLWSKLARNIIVAARDGGGDPVMNLGLRYAIDKAKQANMPRDTIEKAIKKGTGEIEGVTYEPFCYEGYGVDGVAILVDCLTDNRNRTAPEIRKIFERHGGNMGATGCVSWLFTQKGFCTVSADDAGEDQIMDVALTAGAEDYVLSGDTWEVTTTPDAFEAVRDALRAAEIPTRVAELAMIPATTVTLGAESGRKVLHLLEAFDEHDDVQEVYSNFYLPEEIMQEIADLD